MATTGMAWGSVADWMSGIGSLAAAIVALLLARKSERLRIRGSVGISTLIGETQGPREVICLHATNVGFRTATFNEISIRVGHFRRRTYQVVIMPDAFPTPIPKVLKDGESCQWHLPLEIAQTWMRERAGGAVVRSRRDVWSLRVVLHTTHGQAVKLTPQASFRTALQRAFEDRDG